MEDKIRVSVRVPVWMVNRYKLLGITCSSVLANLIEEWVNGNSNTYLRDIELYIVTERKSCTSTNKSNQLITFKLTKSVARLFKEKCSILDWSQSEVCRAILMGRIQIRPRYYRLDLEITKRKIHIRVNSEVKKLFVECCKQNNERINGALADIIMKYWQSPGSIATCYYCKKNSTCYTIVSDTNCYSILEYQGSTGIITEIPRDAGITVSLSLPLKVWQFLEEVTYGFLFAAMVVYICK